MEDLVLKTVWSNKSLYDRATVKKLNLLLCSAGSVTKKRMKNLLNSMQSLSSVINEFHIRVVVTSKSQSVFEDSSLISFADEIYIDEDEWSQWRGRGDPVLHIDLTKWADILILAPLDLNTMAKIATGICDNLLTCTLRAWNLKKPVIFCPAIPIEARKRHLTESHIATLQSWGYKELFPTGNNPVVSGDNDGYPMVDSTEITKMVILLLMTQR